MGSKLISYDAVESGPYSSSNIVAKVLSSDDSKKEMEDLLQNQKDEVHYLLEQNRDLLEALRDALLEHEELLGDDIAAVIESALARRTSSPTT
jgi:cell division protease FtsH